MQIGSESFDFKVNGVVQANKFASKLSTIVYLTDSIKSAYEKSVKHPAYSAAFVKVNNVVEAEHYFNNDYRAMGKAGDRSWYKDDDSYNFAINSLLEIPVGKEVTNIAQIKANATSNTDSAVKTNLKNIVFAVCSVFVANIIFWLIVLFSQLKDIKKRRYGNKGEKCEVVIREFRIGGITSLLLFAASFVLLKVIANGVLLCCLFVSAILSLFVLFMLEKRILSPKKDKA